MQTFLTHEKSSGRKMILRERLEYHERIFVLALANSDAARDSAQLVDQACGGRKVWNSNSFHTKAPARRIHHCTCRAFNSFATVDNIA